jgi:hypothetical protein
MSITRPEFTRMKPSDLLVIFRRYDKPTVLYTVHRLTYTDDYLRDTGFFAFDADEGYTYEVPMEILDTQEVDELLAKVTDQGYQRVALDWADMDPDLLRIISQCGPIQSHEGLATSHPSTTGRVRVLAKAE